MKGFSHFLSGVAVATCLPGVTAPGSFLPVLAGVCALLPDTLDFRLARFFERADRVLAPGPSGAQGLAADVAQAVLAASSGSAQTLRLRSVRAAPDRWRRYALRFDSAQQALEVRVGPLVSGSQVALPGSEPEGACACARVPLAAPLDYSYDDEIVVDVFAGPSLRFEPLGLGRGQTARRLFFVTAPHPVRLTFLPWHRERSHSLVLALLAGLAAGLLFGPLAAAVAALGYAVHVLEDQLGAMGANLLWPFTRGRSAGLGLLRSGDALPNFLTVWLAVSLILFNLDRYSARPHADAPALLGALAALPVLALAWQRLRRAHEPAGTREAREVLAETEVEHVAS